MREREFAYQSVSGIGLLSILLLHLAHHDLLSVLVLIHLLLLLLLHHHLVLLHHVGLLLFLIHLLMVVVVLLLVHGSILTLSFSDTKSMLCFYSKFANFY